MTQLVFAQFDYGFNFNKAGSAGLQFLKIGIGARETAMGQAAGSMTENSSSVFWNPAGVGFSNGMQMMVTHQQWLVDSRVDAVAMTLPVKSLVVGLSAVNFAIKEYEETTAMAPYGTGNMIRAGDMLVGLTVARRFSDKLSIGGQIKWVQEVLDDRTFDNILFDIGTIYKTGFRNLQLGFAFQHYGPDMKIADLLFRTPLLFRVSAVDDVFRWKNQRLTLAAELIHPTDNNEIINIGLEYELLNMIALRGGYRVNVDEGNLSFGFGINPPAVIGVGTHFDYSMVSFGNIFGEIHQFTLSFTL